MAPPSIVSLPWDVQSQPQSHSHRASFTSRVSAFFDRRNAPSQIATTERNTATYEVPLFLSPTRYQRPTAEDDIHPMLRSRNSTRSVIDAAASVFNRIQPLSLPSSSRYSSPTTSPVMATRVPVPVFDDTRNMTMPEDTESALSKPETVKNTPIRQRRRRRTSLRRRIQSQRQLSIAFGVTLLLGLITYLVLALTGIASGIMFHVLTLLLLLALAGVFLHSTIRLFALFRQKRERADRHHEHGWTGHQTQRPYFCANTHIGAVDEVPADKPIRIIMAEDEHVDVVKENIIVPPPVYGNFRESRRMNPNLIHWRMVPPSPLTPTYAEAMNDVQREVGYRPPSYLISEGGATQIIETQRRDVDQALRSLHPFEEKRAAALTGEAF